MKITIKQSGGFAGNSASFGPVDTAKLPASVSADLARRVARLPADCAERSAPIGADFVTYEVSVVSDDQTSRAFRIADEGNPSDPLLQEVVGLIELLGHGG